MHMQITFRPFCQSLEFGDVVSRKFKNCQDRKDIISYVNFDEYIVYQLNALL